MSHTEERKKWERERQKLTEDSFTLTNQVRAAASQTLEANLQRDKIAHHMRALSLRPSAYDHSMAHDASVSPTGGGGSPIITGTVGDPIESTPSPFDTKPVTAHDLPPILKLRVIKSRPESAPPNLASPDGTAMMSGEIIEST